VTEDSEPPERSSSANTDPDRLFTPEFVRVLLVQMSFGFSFSIFLLLPKFLAVELGAGPELIGRVTAMAGVVGVLSVPFVGAWIDRRARRFLIAGGTLLTSLTAFGFAWVESVDLWVFALRAVQGLAFVVVFNAGATLASDLAPRARLSQALGIFGLSAVCMNAVAPAIAEPFSERFGWGKTFGLAACASLLAMLLALGIRERRPEPARPRVRSGLLERRSLAILYAVGIGGAAFGALFTFVPPFALKLGISRVSGFFVGYTLAVVCVRVMLGSLADRHGRRRVALLALSAYGIVTAAMAWLRPELLVAFGACFGAAHGLFYPALNGLAIEGVPDGGRGSVMTFFNGAFNAGWAASALGLGTLAEHFGFPFVFLLMGVMTSTAVVMLALMPPAVVATRTEIE